MRRSHLLASLAIAVAAVLAVFPLLATPVQAHRHTPISFGPEFECFGFVPDVPVDPLGGAITADIVVALDGVDEAEALAMMELAEVPYRSGTLDLVHPDVRFNIVAVHDVSAALADATNEVNGFIIEPGENADDLMSSLIRLYREQHPDLDRDAVHLFTDRNIYVDFDGEELDAVLGIANCIGSIGIPEYAFSISQVTDLAPVQLGLWMFFDDINAKVVAHELGHIFGAHHHYANCAENAAFALSAGTGDVCTLMYNDVSLVGMQFSGLSAGVARGFAERHIDHDH